MRLAKPHLDIGLFTDDLDRQRLFWEQTVGLKLDHELELAPGWVQHRYAINGSVVKVNHLPDGFPDLPPTGYRGLTIAKSSDETSAAHPDAWLASHPGGDAVNVVSPGTNGIDGIAVTVLTTNPDAMLDFYVDAMQFDRVDNRTVRCGDSLLHIVDGPGGLATDDCVGNGFRYLTVQVFDADHECAEIIERGGRLMRAPVSFQDVARYGFVADPDGNWIEVSARTSLTGIAPK